MQTVGTWQQKPNNNLRNQNCLPIPVSVCPVYSYVQIPRNRFLCLRSITYSGMWLSDWVLWVTGCEWGILRYVNRWLGVWVIEHRDEHTQVCEWTNGYLNDWMHEETHSSIQVFEMWDWSMETYSGMWIDDWLSERLDVRGAYLGMSKGWVICNEWWIWWDSHE